MNSNRLPLIGFVIMMIVAVFALAMQQQAVNDVRAQMTQAAKADDERVTAVAMAQAASGTQVQAEIGQATALAAAQGASTAQATAQSAAATAIAQLADEGTRSAQVAATNAADIGNVQATVTMHVNDLATVQAESTAELATLQGQLDEQATKQADLSGQLGTATAQVDLAEFARKVAEDDRSNALNQLWAISTIQADNAGQLATAQALLTVAPPATAAPQATATPELQVTTVNDAATAVPNDTASSGRLPQLFVGADKKIQVGYPEGWFAQETQNGRIIIVNQEAIFSTSTSKMNPGQMEIDVLAGTYTDFGLTDGTTPQQLMETIVGNFKSQQPTFVIGSITPLKIGSYDATQVLVDDTENDLIITIMQLNPSAIGLVYGLSAKGEGASNMNTLLSVAASVTYIE